MTNFYFLLFIFLVGIILWGAFDPKYPKVSRAGFIMFVLGLASICYGTHPILPPWFH